MSAEALSWPVDARPRSVRALLIIVHGLAEHAARYVEIGALFAGRGIATLAYDQIGHGGHPTASSAPTHVDRFADLVSELATRIDHVRSRAPDVPLFVWGHSMGSIVSALCAARSPHAVRGVITSSNSLEIFRRGIDPLNPFFRLASRIVPRVRIPLGLDPRKISSDESVQRAYAQDPRIPPTASLRLIVEFAAACERVREVAPALRVPWLNVHGADDAIAPPAGSSVLHELLGSPDKTLRIHPGARHEVHNEREPLRSAFLAELGDWILQRSG